MKKPIVSILIFFFSFIFLSCVNNSNPELSSQISSNEIETPINRFESEIENFEKWDSLNGIKEGKILFTGSSSIRMWKTLSEDLQEFEVLNRGFGGATLPEVIHYFDRIIKPYNPEILVLYCGENDISEGNESSRVYSDFIGFYTKLKDSFPDCKLVYITMKPSVARWQLWSDYQKTDSLLNKFISSRSDIELMNSSLMMLDSNYNVRSDIFIEDGLHMNDTGYALWKKQLIPILNNLQGINE